MPDHALLSFMYLAYVVVGTVFLGAVFTVAIWLSLATLRPGGASATLLCQEFVWTLVPVIVFVGLTVLGEIPRGWVKLAAVPRAAEVQSRVVQ